MRRFLPIVLILVLLAATARSGAEKEPVPEGVRVYAEARRITFDVLKNATWKAKEWCWEWGGAGSGIGFRRDGWILATAHQVKSARSVIVVGADGLGRAADVWRWWNPVDLAVIHVPGTEIPEATFGDSDRLRVGETVYAAGRPVDVSCALNRGIVSRLHLCPVIDGVLTESIQDYIGTDAQAVAGSSGGPILDPEGQVVGLLCESFAVLDRPIPGMAFALPSNLVTALATRLIEDPDGGELGTIEADFHSPDPWPEEVRRRLGHDSPRGCLLCNLKPSAQRQGLAEEDIVLAVDGTEVWNWTHLRALLAVREPGTRVTLDLLRKGKRVRLAVELGAYRDD